jgi:cyclic pyranopterin phosphate synthase
MFTHIDENGDANMVDVSKKNDTLREAIAKGSIILNKEIINAIVENRNKKGDVLSTSRLAGIQAAKRTSDLIPLAHNLNLTKIEIEFSIDDKENMIHCEGLVECFGKTGVEMEALTCCFCRLTNNL